MNLLKVWNFDPWTMVFQTVIWFYLLVQFFPVFMFGLMPKRRGWTIGFGLSFR